jgi:hypothetical protein
MKTMRGLLVGVLLLFTGASCNDNSSVIATGIAGNNFFLTWQLTSVSLNSTITCAAAGADRVVVDVFKEETAILLTSSFPCDAYQGLTTQFAANGDYHVAMRLLDPAGTVLSVVTLDQKDITIPGTVDLGHVNFLVP